MESVCWGNSTVGSNPTLSARTNSRFLGSSAEGRTASGFCLRSLASLTPARRLKFESHLSGTHSARQNECAVDYGFRPPPRFFLRLLRVSIPP